MVCNNIPRPWDSTPPHLSMNKCSQLMNFLGFFVVFVEGRLFMYVHPFLMYINNLLQRVGCLCTLKKDRTKRGTLGVSAGNVFCI